MKTLKMTVELTYDDELMHGGDSKFGKDWFFYEVLEGPDLQLVDFGDVGDVLGTIKVTGIT
jgi:6-phosphogluconate dehydrogenase (decarboxylating)